MRKKLRLKRFNSCLVLWTILNAVLFGVYLLPLVKFSLLWSYSVVTLFSGSCIWCIIIIRQLNVEADLKQKYFNHESKRHFQVLQSLIYIERYDEAKSYLQQVTESQF